MHYSYANFLNLHANDFCGYWVGDFEFSNDTFKGINIDPGRTEARVIINENVVATASEHMIVPYTFKQGKHRIEVDYSEAFGWRYDITDVVKTDSNSYDIKVTTGFFHVKV